MDLKRFSLGKEKGTNSNTIITHNKEPISTKRIFTCFIDPPNLHIAGDDYHTLLDLKLYKESDAAIYFVVTTRFDDINSVIPLEKKGYSANIFPELSNELLRLNNKIDDISLRFYYNLIIISRICEAICNAGISLRSVEFDRNSLNRFVNKSLEFYGYNNYDFDCNIVMNILHSNTEPYDDFVLNNIYGCKGEFNIGNRKGILGYTDRYVYLRMDTDTIVTLTIALAVDIMSTVKETSSSIIEALAWILLTSKGYYVHEQDFTNSRPFLSECLSAIWTEERSKITPDNFAQCFK